MTTTGHEHGSALDTPEEGVAVLTPETEAPSDAIDIGMPGDAAKHKVEDVQAAVDAEQAKDPMERIAELEEKLGGFRDKLSHLGAKRGTRLFSRKHSAKTELYEVVHGQYTEALRDLGRLKLEQKDGEHFEDVTDETKSAAVVKYLIDEQNKLRQKTTEHLEGTPMGKVVAFMNKGGRLKKFMKYAAIGVAGGALAAVTGGLGAGMVATVAVGAGARFGRGFLSAEGRNGRKLNEADESLLSEHHDEHGDDSDALIDAGAQALASTYDNEIKDRQKGIRRSVRRGLTIAALGSGIGAAVHAFEAAGVAHAAPNPVDKGVVPKDAAAFRMADERSMDLLNGKPQVESFTYDKSLDPFFATDKGGIHDMGNALKANPLDGDHPAGYWDLSQRMVLSPELLASFVTATHENIPNSITDANGLSQYFRAHPDAMKTAYDQVMKTLNDPSTHITTGKITNPFASIYGVDAGNGNVHLAAANYVNEGGTKMVFNIEDPTTHIHRVLELRADCTNIIEELQPAPAPVAAPIEHVSSYVAPNHATYIAPHHIANQVSHAIHHGGQSHTPGHSQPSTPVQSYTPSQPNIPVAPITPVTPNVPVTPTTPVTEWGKTGPVPNDGHVTNTLGSGNYEPTPTHVDQVQSSSVGDRPGVGTHTVPESSTAPQTAATGTTGVSSSGNTLGSTGGAASANVGTHNAGGDSVGTSGAASAGTGSGASSGKTGGF